MIARLTTPGCEEVDHDKALLDGLVELCAQEPPEAT